MTRHVLDILGDPWDGTFTCTRCHARFDYAADGWTECPLSRPWSPARVAQFHTNTRNHG